MCTSARMRRGGQEDRSANLLPVTDGGACPGEWCKVQEDSAHESHERQRQERTPTTTPRPCSCALPT